MGNCHVTYFDSNDVLYDQKEINCVNFYTGWLSLMKNQSKTGKWLCKKYKALYVCQTMQY